MLIHCRGMKTTTLLICSLSALSLLASADSSPTESAPMLAAPVSGRVHYGEVLEAERDLLACRVRCGEEAPAALQAELDALVARYEDFLRRHLEGGVMDYLSANKERIKLLEVQLQIDRYAGKPEAETLARIRALYQANLDLQKRRYGR